MTYRLHRLATVAVALILLAGCNSNGDSAYSQFYRIARQSWSASMGNVRVSREQAAAIPYASLGYRVDGGNEGLLVLATDTNGEQLWTSAARIVIITRDGRITRTVGLGHDLTAQTFKGSDLPAPSTALQGAFSTTRIRDFADLGLYGVTVTCRATARGRQTIQVLGQAIATVRVDDICQSRTRNWTFVDNYWVDPQSGLAWRTRQHLHPEGGMIETQIFRPPG